MGSTYLPINSNWFEYINRANETYNKLQREVRDTLMSVADEACKKVEDKRLAVVDNLEVYFLIIAPNGKKKHIFCRK